MSDSNTQTELPEIKKRNRYVGSIILSTLSLVMIVLGRILRTNYNYPFPVDSYKIGYLIGGILIFFVLSGILAVVFFTAKRYLLKHKNNTIHKPFAVLLFIFSVISLIRILFSW